MGLFEDCFTWGRAASLTGVLAVIILFIGGFATIFSATAACWAVALYMIILSILVGALEAPNVIAICGVKNEGEGGLSARMASIKGYYRSIFYVVGSVGLLFCLDVSTVLAFLLLFSSGFFHFLQWLGPRGGHPQSQKYSDLRSDLVSPGDDNDDDSAVHGGQPSWAASAQDAAGKAVAAAAVAHVTRQISAANPFASSAAKKQPESEGNPFAAPAAKLPASDPFSAAHGHAGAGSPDLEDNPFLDLNRPQ